uniref:chitin synthase n=1 Tax=Ascaris suum TaxID=6253 RepID=F1KQV7_ASCSU
MSAMNATANDSRAKWDAFRSQSHAATVNNELKPWMVRALRVMKLLIFISAHIMLICGATMSKLTVVLMATNVRPKGVGTFLRQKCSSSPPARSREIVCAMLCSLWLIQNLPDVAAILQALWRLISHSKHSAGISLTVIFMEAVRAAGISLLVFCVFPNLDGSRCLLLSVFVVIVPLWRHIRSLLRVSFDPSRSLARRLSTLFSSFPRALLLLVLLSSCYLWSILSVPFKRVFILPLAVLLSSAGFWETWISLSHCSSTFHSLYQLKYGVRKMSATTRLFVSFCRVAISTLIFAFALRDAKITAANVFESLSSESATVSSLFSLALWVVVVNFMLRMLSRFLAAMSMEIMPVMHPLFLTLPLLFTLFICSCKLLPSCRLYSLAANFALNWPCMAWTANAYPFRDAYITVFWLISHMFWAYHHVKSPHFEPSDEVIESMPSVTNGFLIENSLVVYRHSISKKDESDDEDEGEDEREGDPLRITNDEINKTVTLYVCATMWHETRNEMMQMIKSVLKLDKEHSLLLSGKSQTGQLKFRLEAHIFFDDAWEDQAECGRTPNAFFRCLFRLLLELTQNEADGLPTANTRVLVNTAYGGRLVLRLPAGTLLFVHLKDKKLIRHKKRWSQVMYMYYLLGHRIMDSHMSVEDRQLEADNTYILAIDGDSKFEPSAVLKLLHLMNVKNEIGCACGRIHPIGDGVMVWYQKFEYAIAHWFQKAAEHVFGCVLCAPGCFSLFRASALMDDNVMHKYTKTAREPRHFVQYDQGEDRWLSTLLLKQGYRIEYAAAADAETYAPEGFNEFFNQRRRWTPSSIANTVDLLADYRRVCENNGSVSQLYIVYQMLVIGFSLVGPAIMFTMLVYAQVAAFEVGSDKMLTYNAIPVLLFIGVCFVGDSKVQLMFAKVISVVYGFIMLAVFVATANQIILETAFSPTSMFVLAMVAIFLLAAVIHPQEFFNIVYGLVFFLMIPCTYVFLSLYALINLNVINWGTREAVSLVLNESAEQESSLMRLARRLGVDRAVKFLGSLQTSDVVRSSEFDALKHRIDALEKTAHETKYPKDEPPASLSHFNILTTPSTQAGAMENANCSQSPENIQIAAKEVKGFMWMDAEYLQVCSRGRLNPSEEDFWDELIDRYLKPTETSKEETKRIASELAALRNRIAASILIVNGLLVLAIFLIQKHKEILSFQYKPYDGFEWMKLSEETGKFELTGEPLKIEPLGLIIIVFLLGILIVQTFGMFIHRVNTLIGAFHEIANMEDFELGSGSTNDEGRILENARQMLDSAIYDKAHGADGYTRPNVESCSCSNVLYKLQRARLATTLQHSTVPKHRQF